MDEEYGYEYDEGSDIDNWETEEVFQDHEGRDEEPYYEPAEDFGHFGELGIHCHGFVILSSNSLLQIGHGITDAIEKFEFVFGMLHLIECSLLE